MQVNLWKLNWDNQTSNPSKNTHNLCPSIDDSPPPTHIHKLSIIFNTINTVEPPDCISVPSKELHPSPWIHAFITTASFMVHHPNRLLHHDTSSHPIMSDVHLTSPSGPTCFHTVGAVDLELVSIVISIIWQLDSELTVAFEAAWLV